MELSPRVNVIVGPNNTGKSTIVRALNAFQSGSWFGGDDIKLNFVPEVSMELENIDRTLIGIRTPWGGAVLKTNGIGGAISFVEPSGTNKYSDGNNVSFKAQHPDNFIWPFLANRKTAAFSEDIKEQTLSHVTGRLDNLYARVDEVAVSGHPFHASFAAACKEVIGLDITSRSSPNGKKAGFYLSATKFIALDKMGDGIAHLAGLIVNLISSEGKCFLIEEPETDLHPAALKGLLRVVERASEKNQFIVTTHSNIVVRFLGAVPTSRVLRLSQGKTAMAPETAIVPVADSPEERQAVLVELGYEFSDFGFWKGWLFLEESSAEELVREHLIRWFVPELRGVLRTYSANGASRLEPSFEDFNKLMVFVHLQQVYKGRVWVIADGDQAGKDVIARLRTTYSYLDPDHCSCLSREHFELYYPERFAEDIKQVLALPDKQERRKAKAALLGRVKAWIKADDGVAKEGFAVSAAEIVGALRKIAKDLGV